MAFSKELRGPQQVRVRVVEGLDRFGNVVPLENVRGESDDTSNVEVILESPDTVLFRRVGNTNVDVNVRVLADGRPGVGEITLTEPGLLQLMSADAVTMNIVVGDAEDIPTP